MAKANLDFVKEVSRVEEPETVIARFRCSACIPECPAAAHPPCFNPSDITVCHGGSGARCVVVTCLACNDPFYLGQVELVHKGEEKATAEPIPVSRCFQLLTLARECRRESLTAAGTR